MKSPTIMVVDDSLINLNMMSELLNDYGYQTCPMFNGSQALESAKLLPPDLVLMDIEMPEMNGFEACRKFKSVDALKDIPIIFVSGLSDASDKVKAYEVGGVDYVSKPYQIEEINIRIQSHLKQHQLEQGLKQQRDALRRKTQQLADEIKESQVATVFALASLAEHHDNETGKHMERVGIFCHMLAEHLSALPRLADQIDANFIRSITHASSLHDIGKVGIPDNVLLKPGKLTVEEFDVMKTHTFIGSSMLKVISNWYPGNPFLRMGLFITQSHHEKWDGTGYPQKLRGEAIHLSARIMALADVYDAMRSKRHYKEASSHEQARETIVAESGKHFDPDVVAAFLAMESEFRDIWEDMGDSSCRNKH